MFENVEKTDSYISLNRISRSTGHAGQDFLFHNLDKAIVEALKPFHPGKIDYYVNHHVTDGPVVVAEVHLLPKWPFASRIRVMDRLDYEAFRICKEAKAWFRNRPTLEVPDNIILGTD